MMRKYKRVIYLLAVAILTLGVYTSVASVTPIFANGLGDCTESFNQKIEGEGPFVVNAPEGQVFTKVVIKAGSQNQEDGGCFTYTQDTNDGCYSISGIGTATLSVSKVGEGSGCKDISHIEVFWEGTTPPPPPPPIPIVPQETPQPSGVGGGAPQVIAAQPFGIGGAPTSLPVAGIDFQGFAGLVSTAVGSLYLCYRTKKEEKG